MFRQILLTVCCAVSLSSIAQSTSLSQKLDSLSARLVKTQEVAGVNVLLIQEGKVVYNKAFGYADVATRQPLQTTGIFRIASQTKAVTSVAVMMLVEEEKLQLDDPVSRFIPQFKNARVLAEWNPADSSYTTVPAPREITVRDLLRHTSGISYPMITGDPKMTPVYLKEGIRAGVGERGSLKNGMEKLAALPLAHPPGAAFTYGLSTDVLGYLVEVVSGASLDAFFRKRIFQPLEMTDTYFRLPNEKAHRLVSLSQKEDDGFKKVTDPLYGYIQPNYPLENGLYLSGGAGLVSTTADYARFLQMLLAKGVYKGQRLLKAETVEMMITNQLPEGIAPGFSFGLGFALVSEEGHSAGTPGVGTFAWSGVFNTHYWADPEAQVIGLVYAQQYLPASYSELGTAYKKVIYTHLNASNAAAGGRSK